MDIFLHLHYTSGSSRRVAAWSAISFFVLTQGVRYYWILQEMFVQCHPDPSVCCRGRFLRQSWSHFARMWPASIVKAHECVTRSQPVGFDIGLAFGDRSETGGQCHLTPGHHFPGQSSCPRLTQSNTTELGWADNVDTDRHRQPTQMIYWLRRGCETCHLNTIFSLPVS